MDVNYRQLLGAFLLGVMVPSLILNLSWKHSSGHDFLAQPTVESTTDPEKDNLSIPVLCKDNTVAWMELDTYIVGVVLAEMPADFELEALKAQAVVARTYALKRQEEGSRHIQGAVCVDPTCCQAYRSAEDYLHSGGKQASVDKVRKAVEATSGQILTYQGALIEATYFSCSGGKTEDAAAVWGSDVPYLQSVVSPGEEDSPKYAETVHFNAQELSTLLGTKLQGNSASWLGEITYTEGGGVASLVISGKSYTGVQMRSLLDLNSTLFTVTPVADGLSITTLGHGHRVGMSQYGADAMAVSGCSYKEILLYYYQGTRIDKIDTLG